jgi:hypothetical protein
MNSYRGPPMTLGNTVTAKVRLIGAGPFGRPLWARSIKFPPKSQGFGRNFFERFMGKEDY